MIQVYSKATFSSKVSSVVNADISNTTCTSDPVHQLNIALFSLSCQKRSLSPHQQAQITHTIPSKLSEHNIIIVLTLFRLLC